MKKHVSILVCLSLLLGLCGCAAGSVDTSGKTQSPNGSSSGTAPNPSGSPDTVSPDGTYHVLFIGNSHTYFNSMPEQIFSQIAKSAGYEHVTVKSVTVGGAMLSGLFTNSSVLAEIAAGNYDYVVLQEQLARPIRNPELFLASVRQFGEEIKAANPNAQIILYQVWGGAPGNIKLGETGCATTDEINYRLAAANARVAELLTADTLPAKAAFSGLAFLEIEKSDLSVELYASDGYHPSYIGSYLSALTIFTTIFRTDPANVTWHGTDGQISDSLAEAMKAAVKTVVFDTPEIDSVYFPSI